MASRVISSLFGAAFVVTASGIAFAADIPLKAPPPAPAPVYNWTGWYVGVNAGASFGSVNTDFSPGLVVPTTAGPVPFPAFASERTYPSGFIGGGGIGYNFQYSPLIVLGFEADFQGAVERDSANLYNPFTLTEGGGTFTGSGLTSYTTQIDWFGTVRGRVGYVWGNGNVLTYVTGGLAYGEVKINGTSALAAAFNAVPVLSVTQAFSQSHVNTGWVVGYGTEGVIDFWGARNWTWKVEGLYMDLGHLDATGATTSVFAVPGVFAATGAVATHTHFTDGILRAGLNYKFY
jgi:outer membrane immunogenic protein